MEKVEVTLPDGSVKEYDAGTTVEDVAYSIGSGLGRDAVAGVVDGKKVDANYPIEEDVELSIITIDSDEALEILRHTASHIMAQAVKRLYDNVQVAIGPAIDDGFYYDFNLDKTINDESLAEIEAEMQKIIEEDIEIERKVLPRAEAVALMEERNEKYKLELIDELEDQMISLYFQGDYVDLCRGPHLPSTGYVKAFKLMNVAGAYWRGDENNEMLQRIYGTAFASEKDLEKYINRMEEAKKRDHRKLGKELDLFSIQDEGKGFPFFHPKGMALRNELVDFWKEEHRKAGYEEIKTPIILDESLWHQSGHWDHYKDNMYFTEIDGDTHAVKPMNCPGGILVYKDSMHSYRELPIRMAELGLVHRHEMSGALHGLMRVRSFTQDDAHIYCLPDQIEDELSGVIKLVDRLYSAFGFNYKVELSTKPENAMGSDEQWDRAIKALKNSIERNDLDYEINEGDGAFYGPKIDFHLEDSIGRTWQCGTIQLDFQMPERFDLSYIGQDGEEHRPAMIHRAIYGSIERFIGILIEHFAGAFPTWIAPVQVEIIPVSDDQIDYALQVKEALSKEKIRVEVDSRSEQVGYKIRDAQVKQIPYMLIVGGREEENGTVSVRDRREGDLGTSKLSEFNAKILEEIEAKAISQENI
ncbi:threonine--tRNA ligase [Halanaerobium congolense]|jgi:threonyl-tRNA synthetase|uniref:Threonine--tRNA ligase n=1 Tax=Halanaerobium congolense TaxID=54121 RepID=A0A1M7HAA8_9FIRM|nr:threonine--tRNA ligase [Halanaerobium congolense]PXV62583.1 threonyl-tRNA synthetase [Halanaerobium congolense]TDS31772.1 threonyl-tRNA synthetase [Halanaerobium congolense]TDX48085.1 threonyl-tRNA synthetase [Halanaerobium congolense]SHM25522.1 threonyl-tRNA synthetase [Halanaerobium congolense]